MSKFKSETFRFFAIALCCFAAWICCLAGRGVAEDWRMFGRDGTRNGVSPEKNPPLLWEYERPTFKRPPVPKKNIRWIAELGYSTYGDPVVADGLVWVGTNNSSRDVDNPEDGSLLVCFRASDGKRLYKYFTPRLENRLHDWPSGSLANSPLIEGDRLWFLTNRAEVVCLDIGPLLREKGEPKVVWKLDMYRDLHVRPHGADGRDTKRPSVAGYKDWLFVATSEASLRPRPDKQPGPAPSLICVEKKTGRLVWKDDLPKSAILDYQPSSPLVAEIGGRVQVIVGQGDGWLRSFDAAKGTLLWKFDMNRKSTLWRFGDDQASRCSIPATPVLCDGRIYIGNGRHWDYGITTGRLCCIDPTKSGDISTELAVDAEGREIPHRTTQAVDAKRGEKAIANPNSGLIWEYTGFDSGDEESDLKNRMYGMIASVAVADGLVISPDEAGFVRCLDAKTGKLHWTYDMLGGLSASPLVVGGYVYVADEGGEVAIFKLSADPNVAMPKGEPVAVMEIDNGVQCSPVFANGTLYIAGNSGLFAIRNEAAAESR